MAQEYNNIDNTDIDLAKLKSKVKGGVATINNSFFESILFIRRNLTILIILFVIGAAVGFFLDRTARTYKNEIIVIPNFGTIDYLYAKVDLIEAKIKEKDESFFNKLGISDPTVLAKIEVKPLPDIYHFVNAKEKNFEVLKLMAEDGDVNDVVESPVTSRNYTYHQITFITKEKAASQAVANSLMKYFNDSEYYKQMQKVYINNLNEKTRSNDAIINQIDVILNSFAEKGTGQGVYISENSQLNDVIRTKDGLIEQQGNLRLSAINFTKIVKDSSTTLNIKSTESVNDKLKFVLPILFVLLFIFIVTFKKYYNNQLQQRKI